jgi:hypothetical protein
MRWRRRVVERHERVCGERHDRVRVERNDCVERLERNDGGERRGDHRRGTRDDGR